MVRKGEKGTVLGQLAGEMGIRETRGHFAGPVKVRNKDPTAHPSHLFSQGRTEESGRDRGA